MSEQGGVDVKQEGISRRRFIKGHPIAAAVAAGTLVSGREEVAAYVSDAPALSEEFESSLNRATARGFHPNPAGGRIARGPDFPHPPLPFQRLTCAWISG